MSAGRWISAGCAVLGVGVIGVGFLLQESPPNESARVAAAAPAPEPAPPPPDGAALYQANCATCHMADGGGVPNFQPGILDGPIVAEGPARVAEVIRGGSAALQGRDNPMGWEMPPFGFMSDAEVEALAAYVHEAFGPAPAADTPGAP